MVVKKEIKDKLPTPVKVKRTKPMPKGIRRRPSDYCNAGLYRHKHNFVNRIRKEVDWHLVRKWVGNHWFLYEKAYCIYDGCGQEKYREIHIFCRHCGQRTKGER